MRLILLIAGTLVFGSCGDGTRVCVGGSRFCEGIFGPNRAPEASAGRDQEVAAGERVELDGTGSFDPDGRIASYSWTQRSGEPVILSDATEPIATFIAPEVEDTTVLEFRLVVTDDEDASDSDHVRVTVRPAEAAALARGIELLKTTHRPTAVTEADCAPCWSFLGLWLAARVEAAAFGADAEVDVLLDALRNIEQLHAAQPPPRLPVVHRRLLELGHRQVAEFTMRRDPATAELARQQSAGATSDRLATWMRDAVAAHSELNWLEPAARARQRAVQLLLADSAGTGRPASVAAATLLLARPHPAPELQG